MAFHVIYAGGGEIDKVRYVDRIRNFAYLDQPYNRMKMINVPARKAVFELNFETLDEDMELLSMVVTCSGYGENDYYYLYVNDEKWFDAWFPTEVKEGLYIGTSTYVYRLPPKSRIKVYWMNMSGTSKKVWLGVRCLKKRGTEQEIDIPVIPTDKTAVPTYIIDEHNDLIPIELEEASETSP